MHLFRYPMVHEEKKNPLILWGQIKMGTDTPNSNQLDG